MVPSSVAVLRGDSNVKGTVTFEQESDSSPTKVSWNVTGNDSNAERGMHIHQFGDNTNGCTSAGPHCKSPCCCPIIVDVICLGVVAENGIIIVNPFSKTHGAPSDDERHVGDLGNYKTDGQGNSSGSVDDKFIKLIGPESVLGVRSGPIAAFLYP